MKQTAVEWLLNAIETKNGEEFSSYYSEFIDQAKEMEKEQLMDAHIEGQRELMMWRNNITTKPLTPTKNETDSITMFLG